MVAIVKQGNKAVYPIIFETDYDGLGSVNCYIYQQGEELTLIDTGFYAPQFQSFFINALASYNMELKNISRILLTHFHSDHTGLVKWLSKELDVPIYASSLAIPRILHDETYLQRKVTIYESLYKQYGVLTYAERRMSKLRQTYAKREALQFDANIQALSAGDTVAGLQVMYTPGHSPDSISFYDAETGWLFAGDALFETGLASALLEYDEQEQICAAYIDYFATLAIMERTNISTVFPGHKNPFSNWREVIERAIEKVEYKLEKVITQIRNGNRTVEQIGLAIYGQRFEQLFTFTVSDIVALIQLGEARGLIERSVVERVFTFQMIK